MAAPLRMLTKDRVKYNWLQEEQRAFTQLNILSSEQTVAFFHSKLPIAFNQGLTAALQQTSGKPKEGMQPIHFIRKNPKGHCKEIFTGVERCTGNCIGPESFQYLFWSLSKICHYTCTQTSHSHVSESKDIVTSKN